MKQDMNITPGQDKFETIDNSLLRLHIDDLSRPIRHSLYVTRNKRNNDGTSSLVLAVLILASTIAIVYLTK